MSNTIFWNLQMSVNEGHLDNARALMNEMVAGTRQETGAVGYEWFLSADGKACHINERYADSAGVLVHLRNFNSKFAERFLTYFAPTSLSVYGEPSTEARAALDRLGAAYFGWLGGFSR